MTSTLKVNTIQHTGGTTGLTITSGGVVTQPTKPMFRVKQSSDQSIANASEITVEFNDKTSTGMFDIGGYFNTSNYRYIPLVAGYYWFVATVTMRSAAPDYVIINIRKNDVDEFRNVGMESNAANAHVPVHTSGLIYMNGSSDYVDVSCQHNKGSASNTNSGKEFSYFTGYLIG